MKWLTSLISKSVEWIIDAGSCLIGDGSFGIDGGTFGVLTGRSVRGTLTVNGNSLLKRSRGGRVVGTADDADFGSCVGVVGFDSSVTFCLGDAISGDRAGPDVSKVSR